jgi:hypothetical protein
MPLIPISELPDSSRLWIFAADKPIASPSVTEFLTRLDGIVDNWQAHGKNLAAGRDLRYDQFLFIAADENVEQPSGCSIDTLTREIATLGQAFGVNFLTGGLVPYRAGDEVRTPDRATFKKLVEAGEITPETTVYNNSLTALQELREGKWEAPARKSWHAKAFKFPVIA